MNTVSRRLITIIIAIGIASLAATQAGPSKQPLNEDAALDLLLRTIKRDHVYAKRISLDCVTFGTDETTRIYFQVAVREKHNTKCGGDPEISPVIDRYRVNRASGRIEWYNAPEDTWKPYDPAKIK